MLKNINAKTVLDARCLKHPQYKADRKPRAKCGSCWLLYVLRHQFSDETEEKLGAVNPYAYLIGDVDLEEACSGIKVQKYVYSGNIF